MILYLWSINYCPDLHISVTVNETCFFVLGENGQLLFIDLESESIRVFNDIENMSVSSIYFSKIYQVIFLGLNENKCSVMKIENIQEASNTALAKVENVMVSSNIYFNILSFEKNQLLDKVIEK